MEGKVRYTYGVESGIHTHTDIQWDTYTEWNKHIEWKVGYTHGVKSGIYTRNRIHMK